jgi:cytochrome c oxidase subunit 2
LVEIERAEKRYFFFLLAVALIINLITISPIVPWQQWLYWSTPTPVKVFHISMNNYQFTLPQGGIKIKVGEPVMFSVTSSDVTYGFGVFHSSGRMLFQMQVLPGYTNEIVWIFDEAGLYTIRSTEYSGPEHSSMVVPDAIVVEV